MPSWGNIAALDWAAIGLRALALVGTWVAVLLLRRYFGHLLAALARRSAHISRKAIQTLGRLLSSALILIGLIVTLALLNLTSLLYSALTAAGLIGIVIGFAVKDVAANFVAGIFVLLDRQFAIGHVIQIGDYVGTVQSVSLRTTTLATLDGPVVTIPNNTLSTTPVVNFSLATQRRITLTVSIMADSDVDAALAALAELAGADGRVSREQPPEVYVAGVRDYLLDVQLACYVKPADLPAVSSDLRRQAVEQFRVRGIRLALPVQLNMNPTA